MKTAKKLVIWLLLAALLFSLTGCVSGLKGAIGFLEYLFSDDEITDDSGSSDAGSFQESSHGAQTGVENGGEPDQNSQEGQGSQTGQGLSSVIESAQLKVDTEDGSLQVERPEITADAPEGDKNTWTIFVYLCGSDLESSRFDGGMASEDLTEMIKGSGSENVRFVVETGGSGYWHSTFVDNRGNCRLLIQNGQVTRVVEKTRSNMGKTSTLADFLSWGLKNYASDHMGVILWNHGGGSITGVCFDEQSYYDSLSLREMDAAFISVLPLLSKKFDFIGFDACLMATIETANLMASYADYLVASQESEPGSGWDYIAIGKYLTNTPGSSASALGKIICNSFLESCKAMRDDDIATLSVIDLDKIDELLSAFNDFSSGMLSAGEDISVLGQMVRGIEQAENFGGNNKTEGYTNMVDLGGLVRACADYAPGSDQVMTALEDAVIYKVSGNYHQGASGLSLYYPLVLQGSQEMKVFTDICVSPFYLSFVDRQSLAGVSGSDVTDYDASTWFSDEGIWESAEEYDLDDEGYYDYFESDNSYWDYMDDYAQTGESALITFAQEPQLDEEGYYFFQLDESGLEHAADVYAMVYELSYDGEDVIELGETFDVDADWDSGLFYDWFDGYWLSLPDGQNLALYIVSVDDDSILYTSPVELNGDELYLRLRQFFDGTVRVEGAWYGIDENGAADRNMIQLQDGDEIVPLYYSYSLDDFSEGMYAGETYVVSGDVAVEYQIMEAGDYLYAFCIDDIYGDYYLTDFVSYTLDENGEIWY
ncbi:MAG: hypothetical protein J6P72_00180 [Firmicutes bacterium]|nr:hypothetical protein [Bacillota bacterium]